MTKETPETKTVRLLDVASPEEIREHPLRSLIGLLEGVLQHDQHAQIRRELGEDRYCLLLSALTCGAEKVTEEFCREALREFEAATPKPDAFLRILNIGQLALAQRIASLVADPSIRVDQTLIYASCGLSFNRPEMPHTCTSCGEKGDRNATDWCVSCGKGWGAPPTTAESPSQDEAQELERLELAWVDREIALLDRPGWAKTPRKKATLERLRGRRAEMLAPAPEQREADGRVAPEDVDKALALYGNDLTPPQLVGILRGMVSTAPGSAASVVLEWERRVVALGGPRVPSLSSESLVDRGARACARYHQLRLEVTDDRLLLARTSESAAVTAAKLEELSTLVAEAHRVCGGNVGREMLADVEGLYEEFTRRVASACARVGADADPERPGHPSSPPKGPPPRGVRYLSEDERDFLVTCVNPVPNGFRHSDLSERMVHAGLVTVGGDPGSRGYRTTAAGSTAIETWRYQVPAG